MATGTLRLFDPAEPQGRNGGTTRARHLHSVGVDAQLNIDHAAHAAAPAALDGVLARAVKLHSTRKAYAVRRYPDTVGKATNRKSFPAQYAELFSGPGVLAEEATGRELPGSPLEALDTAKPFDGYVSADADDACADALAAQVGTSGGCTTSTETPTTVDSAPVSPA